jgi:hypothetical protein
LYTTWNILVNKQAGLLSLASLDQLDQFYQAKLKGRACRPSQAEDGTLLGQLGQLG